MTSSFSASEIPESSALPDSPSASYAAYDVLINYCEPDTRKTLVSHLYYRLSTYGLRVFMDVPELQPGYDFPHQIEKAITTASVHLAILSPRYAQSSLCLSELAFMLRSGASVVPVFYHTKPADLRWISGLYAEAIMTHEMKGRHASETIQEWRQALFTLSYISGFELEAFDGDEAKLVAEVIEYVLKTVRKSAPIDNRHLPSWHQADEQQRSTSLNEKIEEFEHRISWQQQTEKPHIVGIVGFAGVGKTTLAKEFFDRKKGDFKKSLFLSAYKDSLHSLQLKLCKALVNPDIQEDSIKGIESYKENLRALLILSDEGSITEGIRLLEENLRVLLVLDDIDHVDQLVALLPVKNYLSSKSLILIISRKEEVLRCCGIESSSIYELTGLSETHSTELFSSRAFDQCDPVPEQFVSVRKQFVDICQGSPLLLAMYGTLLRGKNDISDWEAQLEYLKDLQLFHRLQDWDRDQLLRLPRYLEKLKDVSRRARDLIKMVLLQQQNGKVQVAGIAGSEGAGKTFLARELFKMEIYEKSCIVYDASSSFLHSLLKKVLKDLIQKDFQVDSVGEGIDLLKEHVSCFASLVILHNVDHSDPMHAILSVLTTVLPSTSLILITSRDTKVLKLLGVKEPSVYELNGLADLQRKDTLEIFCNKAFGQLTPLRNFEDLVEGFLNACNGLPLTLRLFGALLGQRIDRSYWQNQLDRLQRMDPADIQKILKIIYDHLTIKEQKMFLHIACSCIGEKRALALRLSRRRGSGSSSDFTDLQTKCVVEVDSEDCIIMHEQLRDLGRTIAHQKGLLHPLWPPTENNPDLLQQSSVIREVRGFMIVILIMMMSMMIWSMGLKIIILPMIAAMIIWYMP